LGNGHWGIDARKLLTDFPSLPVAFLFTATAGVVISSLTALGEEIGWRGFLTPALRKLCSFTQMSFLVGNLWFLYHLPLLLFTDYLSKASNAPLPLALTCFFITILSATFIAGWLRLKTGSVWPAVLLHAVHNIFIQYFFDSLTVDRGKTNYITTEFGIGLAILYSLSAFYFWTRRKEVEKQ
jgi:membrane protease YdiL (CAAX protease family)